MRVGREQVTLALASAPRMSAIALLNFLPISIRQRAEEATARIYFAECVRIATENTAKMVNGEYMAKKYMDIVNGKRTEEKSCEEITEEIVAACGLEVIP